MGRKAKFTDDQFLDATCRLVAQHGPGATTVAAVAGSVGAPIGSVYHRFASKEDLLARLWLRTVEEFQRGFLEILRTNDGLRAALYTPTWIRANPDKALVLLLHRREEFLSKNWTAEVRRTAEWLGNELHTGIREFCKRAYGEVSQANLRRSAFVLIDVPYAAVKRHLEIRETPPVMVDGLIEDTYRSVMGSVP
jgi:AcrR family transcriptional regulator